MALGSSLFLMAVGAVLAFGVTTSVSGLDLDVIGLVLMVVGGIGLLMTLLFLSSFAPFASGRIARERRTDIIDREI